MCVVEWRVCGVRKHGVSVHSSSYEAFVIEVTAACKIRRSLHLHVR